MGARFLMARNLARHVPGHIINGRPIFCTSFIIKWGGGNCRGNASFHLPPRPIHRVWERYRIGNGCCHSGAHWRGEHWSWQPALKLILGIVFSPNEKTTVMSTALEKRVEATQLEIFVDLFIPTPFLILLRDSFDLFRIIHVDTVNNTRSRFSTNTRSREAQIVTTTGLF